MSEIDTADIRMRAADDRGAPYHPDVEGWEIVALCDEVDRLRAALDAARAEGYEEGWQAAVDTYR